MRVDLLSPDQFDAAAGGLADVLVDCVHGGASVGFLAPLAHDVAAEWWRAALRASGHLTWAAWDDRDRIAGCVQLRLATLPNSRHRAEVGKLLVHRRARGQGAATKLLTALEATATAHGRTLLLLDTETGSPAEDLYRRLGWQPFGRVDDHAALPDGRLAATTFMLKRLDSSSTNGDIDRQGQDHAP